MERYRNSILLVLLLVSVFVFTNTEAQKSDPLPDGYYNVDVGEPDLPSKTIYKAKTDLYTMAGGGRDTWGTNDECNFTYFETEEDKEVVVRILNVDESQAGWNSKAFIMIRSSLEPEAAMCFLESRRDNNVFLSGRREEGINAEIFGRTQNVTPAYPRWLKFVRQGRYITGYHADVPEEGENIQWERVATVELALKGKAYLGIGVCGAVNGTGYISAEFDQLEVRDIEIPYEVVENIDPKRIRVGMTNNIDVTGVFGHYIGDYWTIEAESSDTAIATATFFEENNPNYEQDGEQYSKKIKVEAKKDGVVAVKLSTNIKGFRMSTFFVVESYAIGAQNDTINPMTPPGPWEFNELLARYENPVDITSTPYTTLNLPGLIKLEEFDSDGEGIAYHDLDTGNRAGTLRSDEAVEIAIDSIGDYHVLPDSAEWLNYTIYAQETGTYQVRVSTNCHDSIDASFYLEVDGTILSEVIDVPHSDTSTTWDENIVFEEIHLKEGKHMLKLFMSDVDTMIFADTIFVSDTVFVADTVFSIDIDTFLVDYDTIQLKFNEINTTLINTYLDTTSSWMSYTGGINNQVKILTNLDNIEGPEDNLAYLYQRFDNNEEIQLTAYIDSVKNTGTGSYTGLMIRQAFDTITGISPFVALSVGAYQGIKFNYRWDEGMPITSVDDDRIKVPCWLGLLKYNKDGRDYIQAIYSNDGENWNSYLKYPFYNNFFSGEIIGGVVSCGGNYISEDRSGLTVVKNLELKKSIDVVVSIDNHSIKEEEFNLSPNPISTVATLSFNVKQPGNVSILVYDLFGRLRDNIDLGYYGNGNHTFEYNPENLNVDGVYLMKMETADGYQLKKFVYKK